MIDFPQELKAQKVWGVVSTWSVDVLYDDLTYDEAMTFAQEEAKKDGQHTKVVLVVHSLDGPPMPPAKQRKKPVESDPEPDILICNHSRIIGGMCQSCGTSFYGGA